MKLMPHGRQLIVMFILCFQRNSCSVCSNSFSNIVATHIQNDSEIRQIMLFVNSDIDQCELSNMRVLPTIIVDLQNITEEYILQLKTCQYLENPRSTLFVITIQSLDDHSPISEMLNFSSRLAPARRRPKVLILEETILHQNYSELFRSMWSKNFLDVTIVEYTKEQFKADHFSIFNEKISRQLYYNPFSEKLVIQNISLKFSLFPEKLRNLHSYPLKIGFFHYPPYVHIFRNSTGHVTNLDGFDVVTVRSIANAKNFKLVKYISNKTTWDVGNCKKELNKGLAFDLMLNKIQFIGVQAIRPVRCFKNLMEMAENFQMIYNYAVVPRPIETSSELSNQWKIFRLLTYFGLLISICFVSKVFRFNSHSWQITNLLAMSLGWCVPLQPKSLIERIIMGSMLVTCFLLSSDIFSTFTSVGLPILLSSGMDTLDDLFASDLVMYVHPNLHSSVVQTDAVVALNFYKRAIVTPIIDDDCIDYLVEHKNISCMIRGPRALLAVRDTKKKYGKLILKTIQEYTILQPGTILMEANSPYVKCLEDVLMKLGEGGIFTKWYNDYFNAEGTDKTSLFDSVDVKGSGSDVKLKNSIVHILVLGYTCSAVVFFLEIIFHHYHLSQSRLLVFNKE